MVGSWSGIGLTAAAVLAAGTAAAAQAPDPIGLDDVLGMEALGSARLSPDGRWAAISTRAAWDKAKTYEGHEFTSARLSRLTVQRTDGTGPPIVFASTDDREGYAAGPFSPDGRWMVVTAVSARRYRLGVLALATGDVRWLPVTPELPRLGQTVVWTSAHRLVAAVRPLDDLPVRWAVGSVAQARVPALWSRTRAGNAGVTAAYSGEQRDARARLEGAGVVEIDAGTGRVRRLAEGEVFDLAPSPDGRTVAALLEGRDLQILPREPAVAGNPVRHRHLLLLHPGEGTLAEPHPELEFASHLLAWSADSQTLLVFARRGPDPFEGGAFYRIDGSGAQPVDLGADRPWIDRSDQGLPVARAAFVAGDLWLQVGTPAGLRVWRKEDGSRQVPVLEGRERLAQRAGQGWAVRAGELVALDSGERLSGRLFGPDGEADSSNRAGVASGQADPETEGLVRADGCLAGGDGPPACLDATDAPLAAGAGGVIIGRRRTPGGASSIVLATPGKTRVAATVNDDLEDRDWGRLEEVVVTTREGPVSSWLLSPSRDTRNGPPPLVVMMYPGAVFSRPPAWLRPGADRTHISAMALVAAGYAVLAPSLSAPVAGPVEAAGLTAQLDSVLAEVETRGLADTRRAALVGHSFGGYGALLVGTRTDRFRAIIASNGYSDLSRVHELPAPTRMLPESGPWYLLHAAWGETGQARLGASLSESPEAWAAHSPLYAAGDLRTPTLLIESDLDGARLGALFGLLYRDNREAALVTYFGEGHVYASPGNLRDMHGRILDWLGRYVRPPQPFDAGGPVPSPGLDHAPDQEPVARGIADEAVE